jgi:fibronectin-binding autotransporter adhesin
MGRDHATRNGRRVRSAVSVFGALAIGCIGASGAGCGSSASVPADGGSDGMTTDTGTHPGSGSGTHPGSGSGTHPGSGTSSGTGTGTGSGQGVGDSGQDSTTPPDTGTGDTGTTVDSGQDGGVDSGHDAGHDAGPVTCTGAGTACTLNGGDKGICESAVCTACTVGTAGNTACTTAYGGSTPTDYVCVAGNCVEGDCVTRADCTGNANGPACINHQCAPCTDDTQCAAGDICETETGQADTGKCITPATATCTTPENTGTGTNEGTPGVCKNNTADMCCTVNGGSTCIPDTPTMNPCCVGAPGDIYCQSTKGLNMANAACDPATNACVACAAVTNNTYTVDPINGNDTIATGNPSAAPSCAFKSITAALAKIGATGTNTTVEILGGTGATGPSTGTGETFPITIPLHITLTTTGTTAVTITASVTGAAGTSAAFIMDAATSAIEGSAGAALTITAAATGAPDYGVVVNGTAADSTVLKNVTISGFTDDGIEVTAGKVTIGEGVVSTANGAAESDGNGLAVTGGTAIINPATGGATTSFDQNTGYGIAVSGTGAITLTGTATAPATGTVTANKNAEGGISFTPPTTGNAAASTVTGLLANGSTAGSGAVIAAGSNVTITNSVFLNNSADGVLVNAATGSVSTAIANINLGIGTAKGDNTFQATGTSKNGAAGICLDLTSADVTLSAEGNVFSQANCDTGNGTLLQNNTACANSGCTGGICDLGLEQPVSVGTNTNTINVAPCTE